MNVESFKVIVIGGGHAGAEAAWAAANVLRERRSVALVTLRADRIGAMSCNPAIGGLAKGQIVCEVDAMGGIMGRAADASGIMFRVLNQSKGPAVRGPRAQCDRHAYARAIQKDLRSRDEIVIIESPVEDLLVEDGRLRGVVTDRALSAPSVVVTTGTFMRGLMHTGEQKTEGGRAGEAPSVGLSASLHRLGFELGRLKTGTPPRLRRSTIDWESLPEQRGDEPPTPFSLFSDVFPVLPQVDCRETRTTPEIHDRIRENLHRAPMFSGQIESVGPRYCPSIEDKVVRFDRDGHTVFLEPESLEDDWVYCNGIATSLPKDVQDLIVRGMPGCERAEVLLYGYAVEYDMVRPHQIDATTMTKSIEGLFLAGQINGTSGYEEAAGQGLLAGCNAARYALGEDLLTIGRDEGYIGVMMDDLVCRTPVEPYRMFTSRAEHRLLLRADNAIDRLTPVAERAGLLGTSDGHRRVEHLGRKTREMRAIHEAIDGTRLEGETLATKLRRPAYDLDDLRHDLSGLEALDASWITAVAERKYEHYIERQRREISRQAAMERRRIPEHLDFDQATSLRTEARQALRRFRPRTFGQAGRLEGITPADMTLLAVLVRQGRSS